MASGEDIDRSQKLFKTRLSKLCEPLVQVQEIRSEHRIYTTCTLTHSSVHEFLKCNPEILSATPSLDACQIESKILASICLKYLSQPRYGKLLRKKEDTFVDLNDEDFMEQHLLPYAAKYWDKHLDDVPFSQEMCDRVEAFVISPQFQTCLQVQSLVIEGTQSPESLNDPLSRPSRSIFILDLPWQVLARTAFEAYISLMVFRRLRCEIEQRLL